MSKIQPRKFERVSHLRDVTIRVASAGPVIRGSTIDLSHGGVRFFSEWSFRIGDVIDLTWPGYEPPVTLGGQIVYVKVVDEGLWVGVRFHQPINPVLFQTLCGRRR